MKGDFTVNEQHSGIVVSCNFVVFCRRHKMLQGVATRRDVLQFNFVAGHTVNLRRRKNV